MKFAFYSDTHLKVYKKNSSFFDSHIQPSLDYFYDECAKRKVDAIFHLGDFFHVKETVATEALTKAYRYVEKISKLAPNFYLVGNHDSYMKDNHSIHLLETFKPLVKVVDTQYEYIDFGDFRFHFTSYAKEEEIIGVLKSKIVMRNNGFDFFFGHFGLNNFVMQQDNYTDQYSSLTKEMFTSFKRAWFGHFHFHQQQDNCMYISSPFQSKHGDEQGQHGFVFYDTDTDTNEFVENQFSPQFRTIVLDEENLKELMESQNHFWRVYYPPGMNRDVLNKLQEKMIVSNYDVKIKPMEVTEKQEFKIPVVEEWQEIVHKDADDILLEWYGYNKDKIKHTQEEMFSVFK
jgi:DNA repair exonuclease SbcCD nuclease subunit